MRNLDECGSYVQRFKCTEQFMLSLFTVISFCFVSVFFVLTTVDLRALNIQMRLSGNKISFTKQCFVKA